MVKKVWKKYEKSCDGLPSSPKSKRGGQAFGILAIFTTPIFGGLWGAFSRHVCPVTAGRNDNFAGQRPQTANRSAAPVSLDRPPLSPRLSARWTQCDDHPLRDHVRERCGQGERRRLMLEKESILGPIVFFIKTTKRSSFQRYISFTLNDSWTARSKEPVMEKGTFPLLKKTSFPFWGIK